MDASHDDQGRRFAEIGATTQVPPYAGVLPLVAFFGTPRLLGMNLGPVHAHRRPPDELAHIDKSAEQVRATRRELAIPLVVVSRGRHPQNGDLSPEVNEKRGQMWDQLQRDQLRLSSTRWRVVAEESGHMIPLDQPEIVVEAIRAMVEVARNSPPLPVTCSALWRTTKNR